MVDVKNDNGYVKNDNLTILILYLLELYLPKPPAFRYLMLMSQACKMQSGELTKWQGGKRSVV